MQILYIPIGVPTFDIEEAEKQFKASVKMLQKISQNIKIPDKILLSIDTLDRFLDKADPDFIIIQNITFANSEYTAHIISRFNCPVVLWTLREPVANGGRLKLNSLTGAFSAANVMHALGRNRYEYVFGAPIEEDTQRKIQICIDAVRVKKELARLKIASIGHTPQGFGFGTALDAELHKVFNVEFIFAETRELMKQAEEYSDGDLREFYDEIFSCSGAADIPVENLNRHLRLRKAYNDFIIQNNIGALASRCWPDFFTEYKTPVCAVLSFLNDMGIAAACEGDVYGALSMFIGMKLCNGPVFFGDPVAIDEEKNTITYWHCGMAAAKLADTIHLGVHPNRKIGPVMDFCCREAKKATVIRIGRDANSMFRMFIAAGEIIQSPKQFQGTSIVFKPESPVKDLLQNVIQAGWEPHYVVVPADVSEESSCLARFLGIEVYRF